ncbi:CopG family transcriptional regulator [Thermus islandicus]|uniref:CopG family transcriptional regulator n=1 Tax=Thermus islandicus TaxID=540988 RepID=UPI0003B585E4|nr:CopG family transcriptional regulator [Thermus islandicus]
MLRKQVHLTPEEEAKLKRLARTTGRTEAEVLRLALDLLPEEEAYRRYLERVAGRRIGLSEAVLEDQQGR